MCFKLTYETGKLVYKVLTHWLNISATPFECFDISKIFNMVHSMAILLLLKNYKNWQPVNLCIGMEFDGYGDAWYQIILSIMCDSSQIHKNDDEYQKNSMLFAHGQCYPTLFLWSRGYFGHSQIAVSPIDYNYILLI